MMEQATFLDEPTAEALPGGFPLPFTREQLRADILCVLLTLARQLHFAFGSVSRLQSELLGLTETADEINDPDMEPEQLGLRYESVRSTGLAVVLELLYDYGFEGLLDMEEGDMGDESGPSWCSRILTDLSNSRFVEEWEAYTSISYASAIRRSLLVCEVAHARHVLEGADESFMDWTGPGPGSLSIRQMSLLSGMSEATVRTLANPKRKNALITSNDGKNSSVEPSAAKAWLQAKGRYMPIRRTNRQGSLDLAQKRFASGEELLWALTQRVQFLLGQSGADKLRQRLAAIDPHLLDESSARWPLLQVQKEVLIDAAQMTRIAEALALPQELLVLRAAEAHAHDFLHQLEQRIASITKPDAR